MFVNPSNLLRTAPLTRGCTTGNALQAAAAGGHSDIVNLLLENKPPALVDIPGGHYGSALMAAVCSRSSDTVSALLEDRANPSERDGYYGSPLERAVSQGQTSKDIVRVLVEYEAKANLSPTDHGVHILHRAAMFGMNELVNYCLDKKCQTDMITTEGPDYNPKARFNWFPREMTPLAYACAEGHVAVVSTLLERGAPFEEDRPYSAPLWVAAYQGHADVVDLLIRKYKETHNEQETIAFMDHLPDPDGGRHFVLYAAASSGNADVVKVLLDHGAPYRSNWFGGTPLLASSRFGCIAVTKLLLEYHNAGKLEVSLDQRNRAGRTALFEACAGGQSDIALQLLEAGASPFIPDEQNSTTLHEACRHENHKLVEHLLKKSSENASSEQFLNFLDTRHRPTGNTALMDCAARNRISFFTLLLNRGADPLVRNNESETALNWVCRLENFSLVKSLVDRALEKADQQDFEKFINQQPSSHKTALIECAEHDQLQALNLLLEKKADYTLHGHFGNTPLLWACKKGHFDVVAALVKHAKLEDSDICPFKDFIDHQNKDGRNALFDAAASNHQPMVNLLLGEGIDWSVTNKRGETALHAASWGGNAEVVSALLAKAYETTDREDFKRFLNARNAQGKTALLDAVDKGQIEIVEELLDKYDADYSINNNKEVSALHVACWNGHTEVASFILKFVSTRSPRERFVEFLDHRNKWGKTALMDATERGRLDIVKLLREQQYNADYRLANEKNVTALHSSSFNGHKEVVALLLTTASEELDPESLQTFINRRNKWGKTALMDAAENNRADVIELLLDHSANYTVCDNAGFTALHYCAFRNHLPAVRALLQRTSRARSTDDGCAAFQRFLDRQGDKNRATALRDAAVQKHTAVAVYLLEHGPAYDLADAGKRTPLHHAVERWDEDLALALLQHAARDPDRERFRRFVNARDENGKTVWKRANKRNLQRVVQRLRVCAVVERV